MPQIINFGNQTSIEPQVLATIKSGNTYPATEADYGKALIIDTGEVNGGYFTGGSGVNGVYTPKDKSIYYFPDADTFRKWIGGGGHWDNAQYLWNPANVGRGISGLYYIQASTTTQATIAFVFASGAELSIVPLREGESANGSLTSTHLDYGFAAQLMAGVVDTSKFVIEIYVGTSRGYDFDSVPYENVESMSNALRLIRSPEFTNTEEFTAWANQNQDYLSWFTPFGVTNGSSNVTGAIASADLITYATLELAAGGSTTFNATDVDDALAELPDLDFSFILADGFSDEAQSVNNTKILAFINTSSIYERIMYVGGGQNDTKFTGTNGSIETAQYYNTDSVVVVHSGMKVVKTINGFTSVRPTTSLAHAAMILGKIAGLEPQVPGTYKGTRVVGLVHELKKQDRETALLNGVLHQRFVPNKNYVINQSITTCQENIFLINPDASSPEISIKRIKMQLNKELIINGVRFIGGNLSTSSAVDVKLFTEGYLRDRTATKQKDNLIIRFESVKVTLGNACWKIDYFFVPNSPINRLFFTGYTLDPNISI